MTIELDSNVPLPKRGNTIVHDTLVRMQVGDSFIDPVAKRDGNAWRECAHRLGIKVTIRRLLDGSYRVWRIE